MKPHYFAIVGVFLLAFVIFGCTNSNASKKKGITSWAYLTPLLLRSPSIPS